MGLCKDAFTLHIRLDSSRQVRLRIRAAGRRTLLAPENRHQSIHATRPHDGPAQLRRHNRFRLAMAGQARRRPIWIQLLDFQEHIRQIEQRHHSRSRAHGFRVLEPSTAIHLRRSDEVAPTCPEIPETENARKMLCRGWMEIAGAQEWKAACQYEWPISLCKTVSRKDVSY